MAFSGRLIRIWLAVCVLFVFIFLFPFSINDEANVDRKIIIANKIYKKDRFCRFNLKILRITLFKALKISVLHCLER